MILLVLSIQFPTDAPKQMTEAAIIRPYKAVSLKLPGASCIIYNPPANHHLHFKNFVTHKIKQTTYFSSHIK